MDESKLIEITRPGNDQSLCRTCYWAHAQKGFRESEEAIFCMFGPMRKVPFRVRDCTDYMNCRRATLVLNPAWNQCTPQGIFYEVATVDGRLVLNSNFWQITEPATKTSAYVGIACGQGFASPSLAAVSTQTLQNDCISQAPASNSTGTTVAAAMALGATYFNYRAAYDHTVECVSNELSRTTWSTRCY